MSDEKKSPEETVPVKTNSLQEAIDTKALHEAGQRCRTFQNHIIAGINILFNKHVSFSDISSTLKDVVDIEKLEARAISTDKDYRAIAESVKILMDYDYVPDQMAKYISERITSEIMNLKEEIDNKVEEIYNEMPQ